MIFARFALTIFKWLYFKNNKHKLQYRKVRDQLHKLIMQNSRNCLSEVLVRDIKRGYLEHWWIP